MQKSAFYATFITGLFVLSLAIVSSPGSLPAVYASNPEPAYCATIGGSWDGVSTCTFSGSYTLTTETFDIASGTTLVFTACSVTCITVPSGSTLNNFGTINFQDTTGVTDDGIFTNYNAMSATGTAPDIIIGGVGAVLNYGCDANNINIDDTGTNSIINLGCVTTLGTQLSQNPITPGSSASDTATLALGDNPTGTITFYESTTDTCPANDATQVGLPVTVSGDGTYSSASQLFSTASNYYWYAVYSGDSNNIPVTSACESLVVQPAIPSCYYFTVNGNQVGSPVCANSNLKTSDANDIALVFKAGKNCLVTWQSGLTEACPKGANNIDVTWGIPAGGGTVVVTGCVWTKGTTVLSNPCTFPVSTTSFKLNSLLVTKAFWTLTNGRIGKTTLAPADANGVSWYLSS